MQIFLAHAKEDIKQVRELYDRLKDRLKDKGYKPWLDEKDLLPGQKWREEIPRAIKNSDFIIICLSSNSVAKQGYLQREFKLALNFAVEKIQGTIFLLPVMLDRCEIPDIQLTDYGENLRDFQWVNYYEEDGFERLVNAIEFQRSKITNKSQPLNSNPETSDNYATKKDIKLISEQGVNYYQLSEFLKQKKWLEADQETMKVLYQACNKQELKSTSMISGLKIMPNSLSSTDFKKIPQDDLKIIDNLWKNHSKQKFGISIQARIYKEEQEDYYNFCKRVGWRKNGRWIGYNDLNWSLDSHRGHLPWIQGSRIYLTEKSTRDFHFNSWSLDLGDKLLNFTGERIISVLYQKVIEYSLF